MILSDRTIRQRLADNQLSITPLEDMQIQPASVDVRLGTEFAYVYPRRNIITLSTKISYHTEKTDKYSLRPGEFVLATTMERIKLPNNLAAFVEGRSSIGRLGLFVQNAGWIDPGFEGEITLELFNASNSVIILEPGRRVAQLVFATTTDCVENPYCGKYQGQTGVVGSRLYEDVEITMNQKK